MPSDNTGIPQSSAGSWVDYWKLTRIHIWPAGTVFWWWPCMWGLAMSAYRLNLSLQQVVIQAIGHLVASTIRHNAACIWNDICDRDFDCLVERTKTRPIASGKISLPSALLFLGVHAAAYIAFMSLFGYNAMIVAIIGFFSLELIYPFCKRFTNWPQAVLGLDSSWGVPIAWMANAAEMDWKLISAMCLGITCWVIHLDTIYACQDKKDDERIGIRSCALLFGDYIRPILSIFAAAFVVLLAYAGTLNGQGLPYSILSVGCTGIHLVWQLTSPDLVTDGGKIWKSNWIIGVLVWGGVFIDYLRKLLVRGESVTSM
ncbi:UbiA prenyltransferase [Daedalea quercina L-15889]|uniref:UbiA prenyltransferase n=1 Tax=Daedalea quercina L-15889 TaxID=1314783 RepID=A0A165PXV8_9APHY|nr:UbiA prenyltransferase [Daedalea quercina L-15889]